MASAGSPRMRTVVLTILALAGAQALVVIGYRAVEGQRRRRSTGFEVEVLREPRSVEELVLERPDGGTVRTGRIGARGVLLHFWATWCPPCREEMPAILALGRRLEAEHGIALLAVSVDADWEMVRTFFAGRVPPQVVRDPRGQHRRLGVTELPDSYLVDASSRIVLRVEGARDWSSDAAFRSLAEALPSGRRGAANLP